MSLRKFKMHTQIPLLISLLGIATHGVTAYAVNIDPENLLVAEDYVTIATGTETPISKAPAVASVITAKQIYESGAVDLDDALSQIPGLYVSKSSFNYDPIYVVRGIRSQYNSQILMLVNGIPMTSYFAGDRGNIWGGLPLENVSRIEVIRGPGSALYGADAFAGVINIITKNASEINGTTVGLRGGSYNTKDMFMLHGAEYGPLSVSAYFRGAQSDGDKQNVEIDAQTQVDALYGTNVSHAPGPLNLKRNAFDAALDLSMDNFRFRTSLKQREKAGNGPGFAQALDPNSENFSKRFTADLTHEAKDAAPGLSITSQVSYWYLNEDNHTTLFPAGTMGGTFPDGILDDAYTFEQRTRFSVTAAYSAIPSHRILTGVGYETSSMWNVTEYKNYQYTAVPGLGFVPVPLPQATLVGQDMVFLTTPKYRKLTYGFLQDEWAFLRDWTLTAGVRYDSYSDVGDSVNPRFALVWNPLYNLTAKLLYGQAFRAPAYGELYLQNNPINVGNPDLKPERINTIEYATNWMPNHATNLSFNIYKYNLYDGVRFVLNQNDPTSGYVSQNTGQQSGKGFELDGAWDATSYVKIMAHYSYQQSIDEATGQNPGYVPSRIFSPSIDWRLPYNLALNARVNQVSYRQRPVDDPRDPLSGYTTLDLTLRGQHQPSGFSFRLGIRNLNNATVLEPSPAPGLIWNDLPMPKRNGFLEISKSL